MATQHSTTLSEPRDLHKLSVLHLGAAAGLTFALVFLLCWIGTFVSFSSPTHAYISLFTDAEISSGLALAEGTVWSGLFGAIVGVVFAAIYNLTAGLSRR